MRAKLAKRHRRWRVALQQIQVAWQTDMDGPTYAINVNHVYANRGQLPVLKDLSFTVPEGSVSALLGPNGAGKSTTFDLLTGQLKRQSGGVSVLGVDPQSGWSSLASRVGVMSQLGGMYLSMTPLQAVRLFGAYYPQRVAPAQLFELVGLDSSTQRRAWRHLSGGEKQRLNLALALIGRPRVLLLDEPTAGLDPHGQQQLRETLKSLRSADVTMLIATHDLVDVQTDVDEVCIIDQGRAVYQGPTTQPQHNTRVVAQLCQTINIETQHLLAQLLSDVNAARPVFDGQMMTIDANDTHEAQRLFGVVSQLLAQQGLATDQLQLTGGRLVDIYHRMVTT